MFGLVKKVFIGLLTDLVNGSNQYKIRIFEQSEIYHSTCSY